MKRTATIFGIAALTTLAAGCGGSSGGGGGTIGDGDDSTDVTFDRDASAINSYLVGATVCVDVNFNNQCDSGEASSTTASEGQFSLTTSSPSAPTLVRATPSTTEITDFNGANPTDVGSSFELRAPASSKVVTPLTTMVQAEAERLIANNGTSTSNAVSQAKSSIESTLSNNGVDVDVLNDDYIEAGNGKAAATSSAVRELIQQTRAEIDSAAGGDGTSDGTVLAREALSARKINDNLAGIATQIVDEIDNQDTSPADAADAAANTASNVGTVNSNTIQNEIGDVLADIEEAETVAEEEEEDATGATGASG
ncbi:hypothetical protein [Halofilum ochraceum]|uniref:hypothetical protein n=1 Tax=Halofilum ochraceum TaxID=1611323 RepID=UPI0008DAEFCF|nr:hypothetical protein [Halofilum ochraceum]